MRRSALHCILALLSSATAFSQGNVRYTEITAKIVLEDGSTPHSSPLIVADCATQSFLNGTITLRVPYSLTEQTQQRCLVSVRLTGYQPFKGWVEDGTQITLYRAGPHEGNTVSTNTLSAPAAARKRYESGEAAAAKKKWPLAEEQFRAALAVYPNYAMALSELGRVLQQQDRLSEAVEALSKARQADPMYIKPVLQLAQVAGIQRRWPDEWRLSAEALDMHPIGFSPAYFYGAEAAFHLGKTEDSEKMAREAIRLDQDGQCPESMVLLGAIFEQQGNAGDALVEYKAYLKLAPHGFEAQHVKDALARLKSPG